MYLLHAYIAFITFLFLLGAAGSVVVLLMTFWEDLETLVGKGDPDARDIHHSNDKARPGKAAA